MNQQFHLTLTEDKAIDLRLALFRAFHTVQRMVEQYKALDPALYGSTVVKYETEAEAIKSVIEATGEAWEDLQDRKTQQGRMACEIADQYFFNNYVS